MPLKALRWQRAIVFVATVLGISLTSRLGVWQLDRAAQKEALQSALQSQSQLPLLPGDALARSSEAAATQHYRHVHLRGRWLADHTVYLDNRQMNARQGFYVLTPLLLAGTSDAVLVQRGWVPRSLLDRTALPPLKTPDGMTEIDGIIAPPPARLYTFTSVDVGTIRQNLDLGEFAGETGLVLRPLSVQQIDSPSTASDGLMRQWPHPAVDVQKHYGYAFQWFAMAALMASLYVWFQLVRPRFRPSA